MKLKNYIENQYVTHFWSIKKFMKQNDVILNYYWSKKKYNLIFFCTAINK